VVDEVVHYCVANMPAAVSRTSTRALAYQTMGYALELANKGVARAVAENPALRLGVNVQEGSITHRAVAESLQLPHRAA
jgi:alanine dehydrogenase